MKLITRQLSLYNATSSTWFAPKNSESGDVDHVPDNFPQHSEINKHVTPYNILHIADEGLLFIS